VVVEVQEEGTLEIRPTKMGSTTTHSTELPAQLVVLYLQASVPPNSPTMLRLSLNFPLEYCENNTLGRCSLPI